LTKIPGIVDITIGWGRKGERGENCPNFKYVHGGRKKTKRPRERTFLSNKVGKKAVTGQTQVEV